MIKKPGKSDKRTEQELQAHYEIEKKLAKRLRTAPSKERRTLYTELYEELYRRVPNHPQLTQKQSLKKQQKAVEKQMLILEKLLDKSKSFLEVGPGDCALAFHVANYVHQVYAVDVSKTITESANTPENFELLISDGCDIPVANNSVDFVYSNQLMEHLHPDDAFDQLKSIFAALAPDGMYLCVTPSRLNGPHDISKYFDTEATGFHLKEYTITELSNLFKIAGFTKLKLYIRTRSNFIKFPVILAILLESLLKLLPHKLQLTVANTQPIKSLMKIHLVGIK